MRCDGGGSERLASVVTMDCVAPCDPDLLLFGCTFSSGLESLGVIGVMVMVHVAMVNVAMVLQVFSFFGGCLWSRGLR